MVEPLKSHEMHRGEALPHELIVVSHVLILVVVYVAVVLFTETLPVSPEVYIELDILDLIGLRAAA